jgi:ascorbate-specific PTS system EIIC-type component UlaA
MSKEIKIVCPQCQAKLAVPLPKTQNQSTPFTTRIRIFWFVGIGAGCLGALAVYLFLTGGVDATVLLLALTGIFLPLFMGQWKVRTFQAARHKTWEWIGKLSWLGLFSMLSFHFSVPLIVLVLGIVTLGIPFFIIGIPTALSNFAKWINRRMEWFSRRSHQEPTTPVQITK